MATALNRLRKPATPPADEQRACAVPDSTTIVDRVAAATAAATVDFTSGQDVLLKKDGKYYCGTVVEVDALREQCFVKFGDNTDSWACFKDLVKLSTPKDPMCVVCHKSAPNGKGEIKECDKCKRAYHHRCHLPTIPADEKDDSFWVCKRCVDNEPPKTKKRAAHGYLGNTALQLCRPLPYDPESLNWDTYHRSNKQEMYCYCGQRGVWDEQMLQCSRCRQWFHDACIDCLRYPLYRGDRFYVFVCVNCNAGKEFVRRLELNWVDLVHLVLYNLTSYKSKKYYDLDAVIMPYLEENWHALQLSPKMFNTSKENRRELILSSLAKNRNRFKCGREIKKRTTIWGLRVRLPPPVPMIPLPSTVPVSGSELKTRWAGNLQLQYLPYVESASVVRVSSEVMTGAQYQADEHGLSETESTCPSPKSDEAEEYTPEVSAPPPTTTFLQGAVKKSVPFPNLKGNLKHKKRLLSLNSRKRDKILRRAKRKGTKEPTRRLTRLSLDSNRCKTSAKEPLTPPTSVSAPPTPPNSGSSSNVHSELSMDYNDGFVLVRKKEEPRTPCDTSGDETSSKSTLDLIIPPPKDFEGKNNPFRAFPRVEDGRWRRSKDSITLPLPLTAVIPGKPIKAPLKRQLSEKDICIGPNGEVKRRRLRRSRSGQSYQPPAGATASKTAAVVPAKADADWQAHQANLITNCVDYALNGRRLRQRHVSSPGNPPEKKPPTPKPSPVKTEPDISMDDLKSSVHSYFGAATRIRDGERFVMRAKRIGPTGKLEYLLEWEGA